MMTNEISKRQKVKGNNANEIKFKINYCLVVFGIYAD